MFGEFLGPLIKLIRKTVELVERELVAGLGRV
jgi:hypothetical protein